MLRFKDFLVEMSSQVFPSVLSVPIDWKGMWDRPYSTNITVLRNPTRGELQGFADHVIEQGENDGESFHAIRGLSVMQPNGEIGRFFWNGRHLHDHVKPALIARNIIPGPDAKGQLPIIRHHHWEMYQRRIGGDSLTHFYAGHSPEHQQVLDKLAKDRLLSR